MADIEVGTRVAVRVPDPNTNELTGVAFTGTIARIKTDGTEVTGYEVEHGQEGMDDPMAVPAWIVTPLTTTAYLCNDIECDRVDQHWPIFDDEYGVQVDDAESLQDARDKATKVVE